MYFPGSTIAQLPIRGQTFGPDANIQLSLLKGQGLVSLDSREKRLILEKTLDRDTVGTRAGKRFSSSGFPLTYSLLLLPFVGNLVSRKKIKRKFSGLQQVRSGYRMSLAYRRAFPRGNAN